MNVPRNIATCPDCNGTLFLEVDEWESDTGIPTETGCKAYCDRLHEGTEASRMPYVYWLPIELKVYEWAKDNVRMVNGHLVTPEEYERAKVEEWNRWAAGQTA